MRNALQHVRQARQDKRRQFVVILRSTTLGKSHFRERSLAFEHLHLHFLLEVLVGREHLHSSRRNLLISFPFFSLSSSYRAVARNDLRHHASCGFHAQRQRNHVE